MTINTNKRRLNKLERSKSASALKSVPWRAMYDPDWELRDIPAHSDHRADGSAILPWEITA